MQFEILYSACSILILERRKCYYSFNQYKELHVIVPISHALRTESTLRIYWFPHHSFSPTTHQTKTDSQITVIINLLKFVFFHFHSLLTVVPMRFSILLVTSYLLYCSHYNINRGRLLSENGYS